MLEPLHVDPIDVHLAGNRLSVAAHTAATAFANHEKELAEAESGWVGASREALRELTSALSDKQTAYCTLAGGSGLSGLEQHVAHGGSLPMGTAQSIEDVGKAAKFAGPALTVATTVFDMAMAETPHEACVALVAGAAGAGGGWGGAEGGAALGLMTGPFAPGRCPCSRSPGRWAAVTMPASWAKWLETSYAHTELA